MNKEFPWLRLYTEARTDNKLKILTDAEHRVWFNLLCFAGEQEERGIIPIDGFVLAVEVAAGDESLLDQTLDKLQRLKIVGRNDAGCLLFLNFLNRQYDKPSDTPERVAERVRAHRERQRNAGEGTETPEKRDVTPSNGQEGEREGEGERKSTGPKGPATAKAAPPQKPPTNTKPARRVRDDGRVYALIDAYCTVRKLRPGSKGDIRDRERNEAYDALAPLVDVVAATDVMGCVDYMRTITFYQKPGTLTIKAVAKTIRDWIGAGRPASDQEPAATLVNGTAPLYDRNGLPTAAGLAVRAMELEQRGL